jgi:hypothetical protein
VHQNPHLGQAVHLAHTKGHPWGPRDPTNTQNTKRGTGALTCEAHEQHCSTAAPSWHRALLCRPMHVCAHAQTPCNHTQRTHILNCKSRFGQGSCQITAATQSDNTYCSRSPASSQTRSAGWLNLTPTREKALAQQPATTLQPQHVKIHRKLCNWQVTHIHSDVQTNTQSWDHPSALAPTTTKANCGLSLQAFSNVQ